jgi:hypothetical protein
MVQPSVSEVALGAEVDIGIEPGCDLQRLGEPETRVEWIVEQ